VAAECRFVRDSYCSSSDSEPDLLEERSSWLARSYKKRAIVVPRVLANNHPYGVESL
jgi:hypothetical protein